MNVSRETLAGRGVAVTPEIASRLTEFLRLLVKWNLRINLVSEKYSSPAALFDHLVDSLQLTQYIAADASLGIDLGSGAGFPGLIISIARGIPFHLIEADHRKCAFLTEAARVCSAPATIHPIRIEACCIAPTSLVTARGLAPLVKLLPMVKKFLADNGTALLQKGYHHQAEISDAEREWSMNVVRHKSLTDARGVILAIGDLRPVPWH